MNLSKKQTSKSAVWIDEQGSQIPYNRTTKSERMREHALHAIAKQALSINSQMVAFKEEFSKTVTIIAEAIIAENEGTKKPGKGNVVLYNFDGSIKIEVNVSDRIEFDTVLLDQCKQKLDELLTQNLTGTDAFIKEIIMSAFETSGGKIDTKKVLSLKKYASRVKDKLYTEAMAFLDKAIRKPHSKAYYQVWLKDESGKYKSINLNFGSL